MSEINVKKEISGVTEICTLLEMLNMECKGDLLYYDVPMWEGSLRELGRTSRWYRDGRDVMWDAVQKEPRRDCLLLQLYVTDKRCMLRLMEPTVQWWTTYETWLYDFDFASGKVDCAFATDSEITGDYEFSLREATIGLVNWCLWRGAIISGPYGNEGDMNTELLGLLLSYVGYEVVKTEYGDHYLIKQFASDELPVKEMGRSPQRRYK